MPDLTNTTRWVEYVPDLLGNRACERPFYFEVSGSLSRAQLDALRAAVSKRSALDPPGEGATDEAVKAYREATRLELVARYATALEPFIRLGDEPLTVEGVAIKTLADYLDFATSKLTGLATFTEPWQALLAANTMDARTPFFSAQLSGGFTFTTGQNTARAGAKTASH
jgi:hypothetical protein